MIINNLVEAYMVDMMPDVSPSVKLEIIDKLLGIIKNTDKCFCQIIEEVIPNDYDPYYLEDEKFLELLKEYNKEGDN